MNIGNKELDEGGIRTIVDECSPLPERPLSADVDREAIFPHESA
jgi:hypothetical protein